MRLTANTSPDLCVGRINYIDFPTGSGNISRDSAYCAMLDDNIYPKVGASREILKTSSVLIRIIRFTKYLFSFSI